MSDVPALRRGSVYDALANPWTRTVQVARLETDGTKTPFSNTNGIINEAINHLVTAPLRIATPVVAAYGATRQNGPLVGVGAFVAGAAVGAVAAAKDLAVAGLAAGLTPSAAAAEGADFLNDKLIEARPATPPGAEAPGDNRRTFVETIVQLAANPITTEPVRVLNPHYSPERERTFMEEAGRRGRRAVNNFCTIPLRATTPGVSACGAVLAASGRGGELYKVPAAAVGAFVGGAVNGTVGAVLDGAQGTGNLLSAASHVAVGAVRAAWEAAFSSRSETSETRTAD